MSSRSTRRKPVDDPIPLPVVDEEDGGITEEDGAGSQEEVYEEFVGGDDDDDLDDEDGDDGEEGLEENWGEDGEIVEEEMDDETNEDMLLEEDEAGSMSPTDAIDVVKSGEDPICYHCGVPLVDPPMRLATDEIPAVLPSPTSASISIPLHCEVCVRGIHSQCHIALGGALPTQEESFVCFHCRTSQHGKYAMKAADRVRVSVGPDHQAPYLPPMFFTLPKSERLTVVTRSFTQVWSADTCASIFHEEEISKFLTQAAQIWPERLRVNSSGGNLAPGSVRRLYVPRVSSNTSSSSSNLNHYWCPFSPDFALTVLHRSNYDIETALRAIDSSLFRDCFTEVCHPPTKPYYNKWKPKDRRWRMMKLPFPPSRVEAPHLADPYEREYESYPRLRSSRRYLN
jgi:hypothetical protein